MNQRQTDIKTPKAFLLFLLPSMVFFIATRFLIPFLNNQLGWLPAFSWYFTAVFFWFGLIFTAAIFFTYKEMQKENNVSFPVFFNKLGFKKMNKSDWVWTIAGTVIIAIGMIGSSSLVLNMLAPDFKEPWFMGLDSITSNTKWIVIPWAIHFFFNIMGEEIFWHGYIMNRQFSVLGKYTWLVNALFWFLVHLVWGWEVAIIVIPLIFIQTFIMQKTRNIWSGILIHGILGFVGDVATVLGAFV